ncbi:hypothetical protein [Streptomyces lushanensis]|uniref:hypothetical protein n=1 Tax=Streptomyces lushanensis TaxID=1434255 RepID=UPI000AEB255B|nr:hypothetical protein [Streptomyces lushanensis]
MPNVFHVWNDHEDSRLPSRAVRGQAELVGAALTRRRNVIVGSEPSLVHAIDQVLNAWEDMVARDEMSEQTYDKFSLLLKRYTRYATLQGVLVLPEAGPGITEDFVNAQGRSRHGRVSKAAFATRSLRRSVVRAAFRTLRELGLSDQDPTRDIDLPTRTYEGVRALTEDEAVLLRHHAAFVTRPTRHAAAAALALAGGHNGEIGHSSPTWTSVVPRSGCTAPPSTSPAGAAWTRGDGTYWPSARRTSRPGTPTPPRRAWPSPLYPHRMRRSRHVPASLWATCYAESGSAPIPTSNPPRSRPGPRWRLSRPPVASRRPPGGSACVL